MAITFDLPPGLEDELRKSDPKLDETSRDAFLVAQYKAGRIGTGDIAMALGFQTRYEAEQWLGARDVRWNYSLEDLNDDWETIDKLLGPGRPLSLVVSDATPINILVRILVRLDFIDLLPALFRHVLIPPSVANELTGARTPAVLREWMKKAPAWLHVAQPSTPVSDNEPKHRGERDAIRLALDLNALILLDEHTARGQAKRAGLSVIGTAVYSVWRPSGA